MAPPVTRFATRSEFVSIYVGKGIGLPKGRVSATSLADSGTAANEHFCSHDWAIFDELNCAERYLFQNASRGNVELAALGMNTSRSRQ